MTDKFVMLDLETLGTRINPVIIQVSAVAFTLESGPIGHEFNSLVSALSCRELGLYVDSETIRWWSEQSKEARDLVGLNSVEHNPHLHEVLSAFAVYLDSLRADGSDVYLWGNGIRADNVWLLSAYKAAGLDDPIAYNEDLDLRTLHYLAKKKTGIDYRKVTEFKGVPHNAIDDCHYQIDCAVKMWGALL